jgi:transcriptional regulator with XRE-family HTH domain
MDSRIRELRKQQGLTQVALAEKAGISPLTLGQLERGYVPKWGKSPARIANALEVPVTELFPTD